MLEQEDTEHPGESNGTSIFNNDGSEPRENGNVSESGATTTTTTVRIHTTYKKRASKFMNRPNVQNGLGSNSFLNPYGGGSGSGGIGGGSSRLATNNYPNQTSSGGGGVGALQNNRNHHHRPVITRSSIFGGGGGGGSSTFNSTSTPATTSPQGTTTSTTTASTTVESRPPFVTTVTRGRFLPSKFDLMVEKSLFTFSSRPKPVGLITRHQCSLSGGPLKENLSQNCQPRGAHDYFNVMWDPHIYRGTTTTLTSSLKQPDPEAKSEGRYRKRRDLGNATSNNSSNAYNNSISPTTLGNRNRYRLTTKVTSRSRTFPPPQYLEGRHQVHVQTEEYLEDFTKDVSRGEADAIVQTDPIEDELIPLASAELNESGNSGGGIKRRFILPEKLGVDASTQVLPGELVSFDEQVQPIVEVVVGKILEQALLETMEEEEISALKAQQNRFLEKRKEEELELKRLKEQQERISAEKERLKRHLELQLQQQSQNGDTEAMLELFESNGQSSLRGGNNDATTAYLLELLPSVINSLRQEGLLAEQLGEDVISSRLVPMWKSSTKPEESDSAINHEDDDDDDNDEISTTWTDPFPDGYQSRFSSLDLSARLPQDDDKANDDDTDEEQGSDSPAGLEQDNTNDANGEDGGDVKEPSGDEIVDNENDDEGQEEEGNVEVDVDSGELEAPPAGGDEQGNEGNLEEEGNDEEGNVDKPEEDAEKAEEDLEGSKEAEEEEEEEVVQDENQNENEAEEAAMEDENGDAEEGEALEAEANANEEVDEGEAANGDNDGAEEGEAEVDEEEEEKAGDGDDDDDVNTVENEEALEVEVEVEVGEDETEGTEKTANDNVSNSSSTSPKPTDNINDIPLNDSVPEEERDSSQQLQQSESEEAAATTLSSSSQLPNGAIPSVECRQSEV